MFLTRSNEWADDWHPPCSFMVSAEKIVFAAKQYNFSEGQIENIARKHIVSTILSGEDTLSLDAIREACNNERLNSKKNKQIGFY